MTGFFRFFLISLVFILGTATAGHTKHFECFDPNFNSVTMHFYVENKKVYVSNKHTFDPKKHYVDPTDMWTYLGNGRFKHTSLDMIKKCKSTNRKFSKPSKASKHEAISICHRAISNDKNSPNPKLPKQKKLTLVTSGEFKVSQHDSRYAHVVIESDSSAWFRKGLHLIICQVDLIDRSGFVSVFDKVNEDYFYYGVEDWYEIKNSSLIR